MNRVSTIVALVVIVLAMKAGHLPAAEPRPNVLFIIVDDLGYGELGCYGGQEIPTPNIDALAASGVRFTSGYATAPFCAASRAALLTGRYQTRFGFEFNPIGAKNAEAGVGLPLSERTIGDRLRDAGYVTGLVGKWHLGGTAPFHPQRRGFDEFFGFLHEGHYYVPPPWRDVTTWLRRTSLPDGSKGQWRSPDGTLIWSTHMGYREPDYDADNPILRSSQPVAEASHLSDALTREACSFIERHRQQPWFLCLSYNAVHSPMQASNAYMAKMAHIPDTQRRIFAAMLAQLDDCVGRVLSQLKKTGTDGRTLVFFVSDNGGPTKELTSSNAPLRGGKGDLWEGGIRVPFILSWNGRLAPGQVIDWPVTTMDATATALAVANADRERGMLDGRSLWPWLADNSQAAPEATLYWRVGKKHALRRGPWKIVRSGGQWGLYNLIDDPSESRDLAATEPERVEELEKAWDQWNEQQVKPLW